MTIGEQIKAARKRAGMTQEELGAAIGMNHGIVSRYEGRGKVTIVPPIDKLIAIADVLNCSFQIERITVKKSVDVVEKPAEITLYTVWKNNWPIGEIKLYPWQAEEANKNNKDIFFAPKKEEEENT